VDHHDSTFVCIYTGFTEENIDEIKETLVDSNLYLLVLTALITALQVREFNISGVLRMDCFVN